MNELRIFDAVHKQMYVIPTYRVFNALENIVPNTIKGDWIIYKGAYGYGEYICSLEDELQSKNEIIIDGEYLFKILKTEKEYFFNVRLHKCYSDIELGLFDSGFHYVRSKDINLLEKLKPFFDNCEIVNVENHYI